MQSKLSIISFLVNLLIASVGIGAMLAILGATTLGFWVMFVGASAVLAGFILHV